MRRKAQAEVEQLIRIGQLMSNVAYNMAQRSDSPTERHLFDELRKKWDYALGAYHAALQPKTKP